jgi:hypothetical protein
MSEWIKGQPPTGQRVAALARFTNGEYLVLDIVRDDMNSLYPYISHRKDGTDRIASHIVVGWVPIPEMPGND